MVSAISALIVTSAVSSKPQVSLSAVITTLISASSSPAASALNTALRGRRETSMTKARAKLRTRLFFFILLLIINHLFT